MVNHQHIAIIQHLNCPDISADKLLYIGNALKKIYEARLAFEFPDRPCVVAFEIPDDPDDFYEYQISFWQAKHGS